MACSWVVPPVLDLFLGCSGCSWVVQVVLGLFCGVQSISNDGD